LSTDSLTDGVAGIVDGYRRAGVVVKQGNIYHAQPTEYYLNHCPLVYNPESMQQASAGSQPNKALWPCITPHGRPAYHNEPGYLYCSWDPVLAMQICYRHHGAVITYTTALDRMELWEITPEHPLYSSFLPAQGMAMTVKTARRIPTNVAGIRLYRL
jgi:hypothetical protein